MKNSLTTSDSTAAPSVGTTSSALSSARLEGTSKSARTSKSMTRRMLVMLGLMLLFIVAIGAWKVWQTRAGMAQAAKFAPASRRRHDSRGQAERWQPVLSAVGSLKAVNGVTVSTDLAGIISQIAFQSGAAVKKGDLLVKLDSSQEEAATPFRGSAPRPGKIESRPPAQPSLQRGRLAIGLRFRRERISPGLGSCGCCKRVDRPQDHYRAV